MCSQGEVQGSQLSSAQLSSPKSDKGFSLFIISFVYSISKSRSEDSHRANPASSIEIRRAARPSERRQLGPLDVRPSDRYIDIGSA